ncbi:hypothetical protein D4764_11G0009150 [Takifugu flavidus]|uniref:Uncharacterized protein n=1 Tax=Takifugu flavidus TaxID=433684 RepID=A0A5C6PG73_9TELE|nr:hypothetical protein D4764_11G0009150 [Takifugu flavidus]
MDPSRILGTDSECKAAFFATVGTPLHRPCSCKGQHDYLLLPFAAVLLVGIAILLPLTLMSKIWMLKRREEKLCQHPEKSDCVIMI